MRMCQLDWVCLRGCYYCSHLSCVFQGNCCCYCSPLISCVSWAPTILLPLLAIYSYQSSKMCNSNSVRCNIHTYLHIYVSPIEHLLIGMNWRYKAVTIMKYSSLCNWASVNKFDTSNESRGTSLYHQLLRYIAINKYMIQIKESHKRWYIKAQQTNFLKKH